MAGSKKPLRVFKKPTVAKKAAAAKKSPPKKGPSVKIAPAKKVFIGNRILERTERVPNASLNFSECEDTLPSHNEEVFRLPKPLLSPKREDDPSNNFSGFSGPCVLQLDNQESGTTILDSQGVADTSSSNANAFTETSNSNIGLHGKKCKKVYECNICNKGFPCRSALETHERIHTGEKPFKCDLCRTSFSRLYHLNRHQKLHTGEKPFNCDVCHKSFSRQYSLNVHQRRHTGEKPFKCDMCNKFFSQSSCLNKHKRVHTDEKASSNIAYKGKAVLIG
ncbi:zinc finger protein 271-like [Artemia franciscana]